MLLTESPKESDCSCLRSGSMTNKNRDGERIDPWRTLCTSTARARVPRLPVPLVRYSVCDKWRRRGKLTACLMVKLRFRSSYREAVSTQHGALEYGSDLHVNERQKIRHYRARSINWRIRMGFFTSRSAHVNCAITAVIHSFHWKSVVEHSGGV